MSDVRAMMTLSSEHEVSLVNWCRLAIYFIGRNHRPTPPRKHGIKNTYLFWYDNILTFFKVPIQVGIQHSFGSCIHVGWSKQICEFQIYVSS